MASDEHLKILEAGVEEWNAWLRENPRIWPDLVGAHLEGADLRGVELIGANLARARLDGADLRGADLSYANLKKATLENVRLWGAILWGADLKRASLIGADLREAIVGSTTFANVDLCQVEGLASVEHHAPSTLGTDTLRRSKGKVPDAFLSGCGLADWEIEMTKLYGPVLSGEEIKDLIQRIADLKAESPIMPADLFISYSHADSRFVEKLEKKLKERHIRYWRDIHEMKAGKMERQIERAIRMNPIVLLVLSENSVASDWVEWEVSVARELEKTEKRDVLCPVTLDDSWKECDWPGPLRRQIMEYNVLDFSEDADFDSQFEKLVRGIVEYYPSPVDDRMT